MIAIVALLTPVSRADLLSALTYMMNYRFRLHAVPGWNLGRLWSLAVEEQFYLLWPLLLLWLRRRRAVLLLAGCLLVAPVARYAMHYLGAAVQFLVFSDALASGCLLSLLRQELWANRRYRRVLESAWFALVPALTVGLNYLPFAKIKYAETLMNIAVAMTIDWAIRNHESVPGRLLNLRPVRAAGVLSYSLYLWQEVFLNHASTAPICAFPANILLALAAAALSYGAIEQPFLRLRDRLEASPEPREMEPQTGELLARQVP
jgi:peptidoglycan/LPS O-acetylase OafA/YrhL